MTVQEILSLEGTTFNIGKKAFFTSPLLHRHLDTNGSYES